MITEWRKASREARAIKAETRALRAKNDRNEERLRTMRSLMRAMVRAKLRYEFAHLIELREEFEQVKANWEH